MTRFNGQILIMALVASISLPAHAGLKNWVRSIMGGTNSTTESAATDGTDKQVIEVKADPKVDPFLENLTERAAENRIKPFLGGEALIEQMDRVFQGQRRLSVQVIAPRGAGKTALMEGFALHLFQKPGNDRLVMSLNTEAFLAGETDKIQSRSNDLIQYLKRNPHVILMVDEVHKIFKGEAILPNALKPLMSSGQVQLASFTTDYEYKEFVEEDAAWKDRSEAIIMEEANFKKVVRILESERLAMEKHHGVQILQSAIEEIARQVPENFPSDSYNRKALAILDQVMASERYGLDNGSTSKRVIEGKLVELTNRMELLHRDREILIDDKTEVASLDERIVEIQKEIFSLTDDHNDLERRDRGKIAATELPGLKAQLTKLSPQSQEHADLTFKISEAEHAIKLAELPPGKPGVIDKLKVLKFIEAQLGIPLDILNESKEHHLQRREATLKNVLVGQDRPIKEALKFVRNSMANMEPARGPKAITLLTGGPGLGKDTYAEITTEVREGEGKKPIVVNFAQMDKGTFKNALLGIAGGYVDSKQGGQLNEVQSRPKATIHLAEIDKLAPTELNTLLTMLDDGVTKDGRGRVLDFRNTEIILSANWGAEYSHEKLVWTDQQVQSKYGLEPGTLKGLSQERKDKIVIEKIMRDAGVSLEFINRVKDKIIVMNDLTFKQTIEVAKRVLDRQSKHIKAEHGITIKADSSVHYMVARHGYSPGGGARSIRTSNSDTVTNLLSETILSNEASLKKGDVLELKFEMSSNQDEGQLKVFSGDKLIGSERIQLGEMPKDPSNRLTSPPKNLKSTGNKAVGKVSDPRNRDTLIKNSIGRAKRK